jgi:hypothetical protein
MAMLRTMFRGLLLLIVVAFAGIQLVRPERVNPPSDPAKAMASHVTVPGHVAGILDRSCRDCHSHDTTWPWYSHVAPVSWLVAHDVEEGREHLNLSTWSDLGRLDQRETLKDMCKEVRKGDMPMKAYLITHGSAALSPSDVEAFCGWADAAAKALRASE